MTEQSDNSLMEMTNSELLAYGTRMESATLLENEVLHRLETYISLYGDWADVPSATEYS